MTQLATIIGLIGALMILGCNGDGELVNMRSKLGGSAPSGDDANPVAGGTVSPQGLDGPGSDGANNGEDKPFALSAEATDNVIGEAVKLSWGAVPDASEYTIRICTSATSCDPPVKTYAVKAATKLEITDVLAAGTYYVSIEAKTSTNEKVSASNNGFKIVVLGPNAEKILAATKLSETDLYADLAKRTAAPWLKAYTPKYPLWTDGAAKARYVFLPPGEKLTLADTEDFVFPAGTILIKEFAANDKAIETRILVKKGGELEENENPWYMVTFKWNDDQTDADLAPAEGEAVADAVQPGTSYSIPGRGQCARCHSGAADNVLGFSPLQLAYQGDSGKGKGVTLADLTTSKAVEIPQGKTFALKVSEGARAPLDELVLGYLHGNCAHCHNQNGSAGGTGILLKHQGEIASFANEPAYATLLEKGKIIPGNDASRLVTAMSTRMPPIGVSIRDTATIDKVKEWLRGLQ